MSYTIDYAGLTPEQVRAKALKDCKEYLGAKKYNKVVKKLRVMSPDMHEDILYFAVSLCGIQGRAATELIAEHWAKDF